MPANDELSNKMREMPFGQDGNTAMHSVVDAPPMRPLDVKPKRIYIAASILANLAAAQLAIELIRAGFHVSSSWILHDHAALKAQGDLNEEKRNKINVEMCQQDIDDLAEADTLIILTYVPSTSGGLHVELGYFLGAKKTNVIVVGPRLNVFFWSKDVRYTSYGSGLVQWLQRPEHGS